MTAFATPLWTTIVCLILIPPAVWLSGILRWRSASRSRKSESPTVSVIVAGRNEADYIADCLRSLCNVDYPADKLEILFVDDHSTDNTIERAQSVTSESAQIRILQAPDEPVQMGSKKRALTSAINQASGELLLFTDADNRVPRGWIRAIISEYDERTGAVIGAALPSATGSPASLLYRLERLFVMVTTASPIGWGLPASACGQNLSLRKKVYQEIGGYAYPEIPSGDDDLMIQEIAKRSYRVKFARSPESVVLDARKPDRKSYVQASSRHQSVVHLYPARWRVLFAASILSVLAAAGLVITSGYSPLPVIPGAVALGGSILLYAFCAILFTRELRIEFSLRDAIVALTLLPFYVLLRPLLAIRKSYRWRGQQLKMVETAR